jgi:2'-5' RNA ligase
MRLFVCTYLSADTEAALRRVSAPLVDRDPGLLRSVPAGSLHLTYAFVGDAAGQQAADLRSIAADVAARQSPFEICFSTPTILYGGREARLIMAPVTDGAQQLARLASDLASALRARLPALAFKETEHFHVTLARFRKGTTGAAAAVAADALQGASGSEREWIVRLQIVSSQLTAQGPRYTTLKDFAFGRDVSSGGGRDGVW